MATKQKAKVRKPRKRAEKVVVDPAEARKQATFERRQALRDRQGIQQH